MTDLGLTVNRGKSTLMVCVGANLMGLEDLKVVRLSPSGGLRVLGIPVGGHLFVRQELHGRDSLFFGKLTEDHSATGQFSIAVMFDS